MIKHYTITLVCLAVLIGVISISPLSAQTSTTTYVIDFEGLAEGAIISEVNCGAGMICPPGSIPGSIKVRGTNPSLSGNPNAAMIFDAECVGGCTGDDDDLFFPGHGNTLIISEDLNGDDPNDGDVLNSFIEFDFNGFPGIVTIESIDVGDIEFEEHEEGAFVHFHDGECLGQFLPVGDEIELPNTGDNEIETVEVGVSAIGPDVECLHVHLNGSGTIDNIKFRTDTEPAITIEKATNGEDADEPTGPTIPVGDPVNWTYVVTNIGDVPLSNVSVADDQGVVVTCPQDNLAAGESMTCTASGTAQAGQYANLGTACGFGDAGTEVCDEDPSHYFGENPLIDIEKTTNGEDADEPTGPTIPVGDPVNWTYVVTNIGDVPLSNVSVADDQGVVVTCPQDNLAAGESMTCTASGTAQAGQYANLGTACGFSDAGTEVCDEDPSHYFGENPLIDIEKATNGEDADEPTGPTIPVGDPVNWTYVVTNIGDVPLSNVSVADDQGVVVTCPQDNLAAGESMTCTASGTAQAGQYANLGTACGFSDAGTEVCDEDPSHYFGEAPQEFTGCTPGFWKNHTDIWDSNTPTDIAPTFDPNTLMSVALVFDDLVPGQGRQNPEVLLSNLTIEEALGLGGGNLRALVRHSAAAVLNADSQSFSFSVGQIQTLVQNAFAANDANFDNALSKLEAANELGCGFDAHGRAN